MSRKQEFYQKAGVQKTYYPASHRERKIMRFLHGRKASRLLDVGCGDGNLGLWLGQALGAEEIFGIGVSSANVEVAMGKGIKAIKLDVDEFDFPFDSDYFDAVFCGEVIEHLFDPDHLLDEMYRVLKPEGFCIITTPNLGGWHCRLLLLAGYQPYSVSASLRHPDAGRLVKRLGGAEDHIRLFTLRALKELLAIHHFKIERIESTYTQPSHVPALLLLVERFFSFFPSLGISLIAMAKKGGSSH